jgi:hypothetical protein
MPVRIEAHGLTWDVRRALGAVRLHGDDGKVWTSGALDAATLAALASLLKEGATVVQGCLLSGTETDEIRRVTELESRPLRGESPFPL